MYSFNSLLGALCAPMDRESLDLLCMKAKAHVTELGMSETKWLYRDKPPEYFSKIIKDDWVLKPIMKDNGGHSCNPINGKLSGLFFMANADDNGRPSNDKSPFGSMRFMAPAGEILHGCNLYFSDFYCMARTQNPHYVQIVATRPGSSEDTFCKAHLHELVATDNPFLKIEYTLNRFTHEYEHLVYVAGPAISGQRNLWVEVFYAGSLGLKDLLKKGAVVTDIGIIGKGTSTRGGIRRNRFCSTCA